MLIGNINFYHFTPCSLTLTLPGGHKVSKNQNLLASFSPTLINRSGWKLVWCWSNLSEHPDTIFEWDLMNQGNNRCFTDCIKCIPMFVNGFDSNFVWWWRRSLSCTFWYQDDLDFGSRSQECEKAKLLRRLSDTVFSPFKWNLVYCWDLFYVIHSVFKQENPTYTISFFKKHLTLACFKNIYWPVSF